ncbi:MAG: hypothetical protein LBU27_04570 [Candidatus Peribacteria bacterium]|nr:hypothetical protein [Candidatus Peribacteria bacterium]
MLSISTFHKAKGREFDNVIICFDTDKDWKRGFSNPNTRNQMKRLIYV